MDARGALDDFGEFRGMCRCHRDDRQAVAGLVRPCGRNSDRGVGVGDITGRLVQPCDFGFEVFDSAGRPIEQTESGKQCAEIFRRIGPPTMVLSYSHHHLAPTQQTVYPVDLSNLFKVEPGHAYTVVVRRSRGLPTVDELGRPIKDVEVSCSLDVPDYGIPRVTRHR